jgi:hypothetical protein
MSRSYFSSSIKDFISTHGNEVLGKLTSLENIFDITPKTTYAWQIEISLIKSSLTDIDVGGVFTSAADPNRTLLAIERI